MPEVAGVYKQGVIRLLETPEGVPEGPVRVRIEEDRPQKARRLLEYGKYLQGRLSTEEDFAFAEWTGEGEGDAG